MSAAIDNLQAAQRRAMTIRPQGSGFPVLAETLRRAGVHRNLWPCPGPKACMSVTTVSWKPKEPRWCACS
jgi:uncharacterized protein YbcV (DUF1398 family)